MTFAEKFMLSNLISYIHILYRFPFVYYTLLRAICVDANSKYLGKSYKKSLPKIIFFSKLME